MSIHKCGRQLPAREVLDPETCMSTSEVTAPVILDRLMALLLRSHNERSPYTPGLHRVYNELCDYFEVPVEEGKRLKIMKEVPESQATPS